MNKKDSYIIPVQSTNGVYHRMGDVSHIFMSLDTLMANQNYVMSYDIANEIEKKWIKDNGVCKN